MILDSLCSVLPITLLFIYSFTHTTEIEHLLYIVLLGKQKPRPKL